MEIYRRAIWRVLGSQNVVIGEECDYRMQPRKAKYTSLRFPDKIKVTMGLPRDGHSDIFWSLLAGSVLPVLSLKCVGAPCQGDPG